MAQGDAQAVAQAERRHHRMVTIMSVKTVFCALRSSKSARDEVVKTSTSEKIAVLTPTPRPSEVRFWRQEGGTSVPPSYTFRYRRPALAETAFTMLRGTTPISQIRNR